MTSISLGTTSAGGEDLAAAIRAESERLQPQLVEARRWFHQRPELSNREVGTSAEVARRLRALGYEVKTGVAKNGIVALLKGGLPGPVIAWRTDMDACHRGAHRLAVPLAKRLASCTPAATTCT